MTAEIRLKTDGHRSPLQSRKIINFDRSHARRTVAAPHDSGQRTSLNHGDDSRLERIGRRQSSSLHFGLLGLMGLIVRLPVIIGCDRPSISVMELENWIRECVLNAEPGERRAEGAHQHPRVALRCATAND